MLPRYSTNAAKAVEVIVWLADACPGIDVYHLVKASFFADKKHISEYGRPICGDNYDAASYGPLPQTIYGLLKNDPIDILAAGTNGRLPFTIDSAFCVSADRAPNIRKLSRSDVQALGEGLAHVRDRSFDEIFVETHDDLAYLNANGSRMDWRDFISEDDPDRDAKREDITETAQFVAV